MSVALLVTLMAMVATAAAQGEKTTYTCYDNLEGAVKEMKGCLMCATVQMKSTYAPGDERKGKKIETYICWKGDKDEAGRLKKINEACTAASKFTGFKPKQLVTDAANRTKMTSFNTVGVAQTCEKDKCNKMAVATYDTDKSSDITLPKKPETDPSTKEGLFSCVNGDYAPTKDPAPAALKLETDCKKCGRTFAVTKQPEDKSTAKFKCLKELTAASVDELLETKMPSEASDAMQCTTVTKDNAGAAAQDFVTKLQKSNTVFADQVKICDKAYCNQDAKKSPGIKFESPMPPPAGSGAIVTANLALLIIAVLLH